MCVSLIPSSHHQHQRLFLAVFGFCWRLITGREIGVLGKRRPVAITICGAAAGRHGQVELQPWPRSHSPQAVPREDGRAVAERRLLTIRSFQTF